MRKVSLDVRDLDYTWWGRVEAFQDGGRFFLPLSSVERLGAVDPETGDARLIDGHVTAEATSALIGGRPVDVWSVGATELPARLSRGGRAR